MTGKSCEGDWGQWEHAGGGHLTGAGVSGGVGRLPGDSSAEVAEGRLRGPLRNVGPILDSGQPLEGFKGDTE